MLGPSLHHHNLELKQSTDTATVKFLCSYGGKILPRHPDGKLRYHGGETRVLAVDRSISFSELLLKFRDLCGATVSFRCQLPTEDLDALVSITSDEDLTNLIEEYDRVASISSSLKMRAFLSAPKPTKKNSSIPPSLSTTASSSSSSHDSAAAASPNSSYYSVFSGAIPTPVKLRIPKPVRRFIHQTQKPTGNLGVPIGYKETTGKLLSYCANHGYGNASHIYHAQNGNHCQ